MRDEVRTPRALVRCLVVTAVVLGGWAGAAHAADVTSSGNLHLVRVPDTSTTFPGALNVAAPPGDPSRLFVVERTGKIELIKDGGPPTTFLDISSAVDSWQGALPETPSENGLSSAAFAPDYATSGRFFVFYTANASGDCDPTNVHFCDDRLVEFHRSDADPDLADPAPVRTLLVVPHRDTAVHHAGQLRFGYDRLLYLSTGDGGKPGDGNHTAQDPASLSGKVLRFNVEDPNPQPQVWALGLRNPYRYSFDAATGNLWLADVGENTAEEVDSLPFGAGPGANFGWSVCEGDFLFVPGPPGATTDPCPPNPVTNYVAPVLTYPHDDPPTFCNGAVVGGFVSRDPTVPEERGRYVFGDFCHGFIHSMALPPNDSAAPTGLDVDSLSAFGQDASCRIYVTSLAGNLYRLESTSGSGTASCPPAPQLPWAPGAGGAGPAPSGGVTGLTARPPAPSLTRVSMTRRRFAVAARATAIRASVPRGSVFVYRLSRTAALSIAIDELLPGRRSASGRCVAPRRRLRRARRCTRRHRRGALSRSAAAGLDRTAFSGRIGSRALAPGRYRATLRARDTTGALSVPRATDFQILAG